MSVFMVIAATLLLMVFLSFFSFAWDIGRDAVVSFSHVFKKAPSFPDTSKAGVELTLLYFYYSFLL